MPIILAYLMVVLIWGTTPLAIQFSNDSVSFMTACALRMLLALMVALVINALLGRRLFDRPGVWKVYAVASIGIFPNMPLVYWSAQLVPSGLIAVIFSLSPFVTGLLSWWLLGDNPFNRKRLMALVMAVLGLAVIFRDQLQVDARSALGVAGILGSCFLFSFSSVNLKKINAGSDAFNQTAGSLLFATPGLLVLWWLFDGGWPEGMGALSAGAVVYLAVMGSLLGFTLFFYVLGNMSPTAVSLITLITPVLALTLGSLLAEERFSAWMLTGTGLVAAGLLLYLDLISPLRARWLASR